MVTKYCEMNGSNCAAKDNSSVSLEKALASFGALAAISIVRKNFPTTLGARK